MVLTDTKQNLSSKPRFLKSRAIENEYMYKYGSKVFSWFLDVATIWFLAVVNVLKSETLLEAGLTPVSGWKSVGWAGTTV